MIDFKKIDKEYGGMICRACLNMEFGTSLSPKDCDYYEGKNLCACCHEEKHIVRGLRLSGKMKTLFK